MSPFVVVYSTIWLEFEIFMKKWLNCQRWTEQEILFFKIIYVIMSYKSWTITNTTIKYLAISQ